jgi:uncharacterized protein YndB with AHSA1/START domain
VAAGRPYREIADWLTGEHDISDWWAQKHIVEYEQVRGLRAPGVRPGGTFTVTASRTVAVPVEDLFDAFVDADVRDRWLPGVVLHERTSRPGRSARFDWEDDATRVNVGFAANGEAASQAAVEHERLTALKPSSKPEDRPTTSSVPLWALARKMTCVGTPCGSRMLLIRMALDGAELEGGPDEHHRWFGRAPEADHVRLG